MPWNRRRTDAASGAQYDLHHAVATWRRGRPLQRSEIVHHLNGDRSGNHAANLEVFRSHHIHMLLHFLQRREPRGDAGLVGCDALLRAWRPQATTE